MTTKVELLVIKQQKIGPVWIAIIFFLVWSDPHTAVPDRLLLESSSVTALVSHMTLTRSTIFKHVIVVTLCHVT
jgi:hypothetical protein